MVAFKNLSLLALAGSAIAAPAPNRRNQHGGKVVVVETFIKTVYETVIAGQPKPTPAPQKPQPAPVKPTSSKVVVVVPSSQPAPPPAKPVITSKAPEAPKPTPTPAPPKSSAVPAPPSTDTGYMALVNEWRVKLGLPTLKQDSKLEANALKTAADGKGKMVHQLLSGTFGQVLAPGKPEDFEHVFVGGWLCERPDMPGMNGVCATASNGWRHDSTGHADILTSTKYKTCGCANSGGIWACDVGGL